MDPSGQGRPSEGVDGWRLDVAFCVPHGFWREWHAHVRSINPEAYTTGEIVGPAQDWVQPDEFSAVMNYEWTYPTIAFFTTNAAHLGATEFRARIDAPPRAPRPRQHADHAEPARFARHRPHPDAARKRLPAVHRWDAYFNWPKVADNPALKTHRPGPEAKQALKLAAVWQFAGPGAPMIYYGTEVGMWGAQRSLRPPAHAVERHRLRGRNPGLPRAASSRPIPARRTWTSSRSTSASSPSGRPNPPCGAARSAGCPRPTTPPSSSSASWTAPPSGAPSTRETTKPSIALPTPARDLWTGDELPPGPLSLPPDAFRILKF